MKLNSQIYKNLQIQIESDDSDINDLSSENEHQNIDINLQQNINMNDVSIDINECSDTVKKNDRFKINELFLNDICNKSFLNPTQTQKFNTKPLKPLSNLIKLEQIQTNEDNCFDQDIEISDKKSHLSLNKQKNQILIDQKSQFYEDQQSMISPYNIKTMEKQDMQKQINLEKNVLKEKQFLFDFNHPCNHTFTFKAGQVQNSIKKTDIQQNDDKIDDLQISEDFIYQKCTLFKNNYTYIQLELRPDLKQLIVTKQNLEECDEFESEQMILQKLKGQQICLDIISKQYNKKQFQIQAGKADLQQLKQKEIDAQIFEVYFLILLDKLNKMHELGVAHSDIKPQNIVISYDNIPYFIDFGGSVLLTNIEDYLMQYTPNYNLSIFVEKYKKKIFRNKEEVILCDKTQLALTFLNLLCSDQDQLELFCKKQYNQLFNNLFHNQKRNNSKIVLSIINRILNQADPNINLIKNELEQIFIVDHTLLNKGFRLINDIVFLDEQNIYKVNRINKFSNQLLYLLDQNGYNIQIIPKEMFIIHMPQQKEYNFIYQKYKQIEEYHESLINYKKLSNIDIFNLSQYIQHIQNRECKICISDSKNYSILYKVIQKVEHKKFLSFTFKIYDNQLSIFQEIMEQELQNFQIQTLLFEDKFIYCKISIKTTRQLQKMSYKIKLTDKERIKDWKGLSSLNAQNIDIIYNQQHKDKIFFKLLEKFINKQIDDISEKSDRKIIITNFILNFFTSIQKYFEYKKFFINQMFSYASFQNINEQFYFKSVKFYEEINNKIIDQQFDFSSFVQIQKYMKFKKCYFDQILPFSSILNKQEKMEDQLLAVVNKFNEIIQKFNSLSELIYTSQEYLTLINIKTTICSKGFDYVFKTFQLINKMNILNDKLRFNFFNFIFKDQIIFANIIKEAQNKRKANSLSLEFVFVNCQFSIDIVNFLKELNQEKYVIFEFHQFYNFSDSIDENQKIQYRIDISLIKKYQQDSQIKFLFFKQFSNFNQQESQNKQNNKNVQKYQNSFKNQKQENSQINNHDFQNISKNNQVYKNFAQQKFIILELNNNNILSIQQNNKQAISVDNIDDVDFIIKEINSNVHYKQINIQILQNKLLLTNNEDKDFQNNNKNRQNNISSIVMIYFCDSNQIKLRNKLFQLYKTIIKNYQLCNHIYHSQQYITQIKKYTSYIVEQSLISLNYQHSKKKIKVDYFFKKNKTIKKNYKQNDQELLNHQENIYGLEKGEIINIIKLKYNFIPLFENKKKNPQESFIEPDLDEEQIFHNQFINNIIDFKTHHCFLNQEVPNQILINKYYVVKFDLQQLNLGDQGFKIYFEGILKLFKQKQLTFNLRNCNLTAKSLIYIYESAQSFRNDQRIKFNLQYNQISYFEFEQVVKIIVSNNPINRYSFHLKVSTQKVKDYIISRFRNILKIYDLNFLELVLKQSQYSLNEQSKTYFNIELTFSEDIFQTISEYQFQQKSNPYYQFVTEQQDLNLPKIINFNYRMELFKNDPIKLFNKNIERIQNEIDHYIRQSIETKHSILQTNSESSEIEQNIESYQNVIEQQHQNLRNMQDTDEIKNLYEKNNIQQNEFNKDYKKFNDDVIRSLKQLAENLNKSKIETIIDPQLKSFDEIQTQIESNEDQSVFQRQCQTQLYESR